MCAIRGIKAISQTATRTSRRDNLSTFICLFRVVVVFTFAFAYYFFPVFVFLCFLLFLFIFDKDTPMINVEREGDIIIQFFFALRFLAGVSYRALPSASVSPSSALSPSFTSCCKR